MKNSNAEINNPCIKEQELTYKCFNDHNFDKAACQLEIHNYKVCKSFWHSVKQQRIKDGLRPILPPVEDRESIKQEYFSKHHN
ncbi:unnamed protein product [Phaedon cochleariae]|uniref:Coiled-coil-helix-coiled-coil-helix domain-containing protein 7 n=1 Tax=Phaedon cochleariae TaxID=80249 RepID=A0A9P0GM03_PHACE|nr:unnamed protein product [Phaedon cochleariae]